MQRVSVADILIKVNSLDSNVYSRIKPFFACGEDYIDLEVNLKQTDYLDGPKNNVIIDEKVKWIRNYNEESYISAYLYRNESEELVSKFEADRDWKRVTVNYIKHVNNDGYDFMGSLGEIIFRNCLIKHNGIAVHASAIKCENKAIVFSAPSGTGKSTQANLWKKHKGAEILNGDRPVMRINENNIPFVYGTPWSASSPYFSNSKAPLTGIVILEQGSENIIRELKTRETISRLMPRTFLPYFDEELMDLAIDNLNKIIEVTPVLLLQCKPDLEAVEMVYKCVM